MRLTYRAISSQILCQFFLDVRSFGSEKDDVTRLETLGSVRVLLVDHLLLLAFPLPLGGGGGHG